MGFMKCNMPRVLGTAALGVGLLAASGCEEDGPLGNLSEQCGFTCEGSVAEGDFSITGIGALDGFFSAVVDFGEASGSLTAAIDTQLEGIQADFGISDADVEAAGNLGAALQAEFDAKTKAGVRIQMQPAQCAVDAQASFEASAECQAEAGCEVMADPGQAEFECQGSCEVDASANVDCGAEATVMCTFQGPEIACEGSCEGTCTAEAGVECSGSCSGTCEGSCTVELNAGGSCDGLCNGTCDGETAEGVECNGTCQGSCELTGNAAATCNGTCEGTCEGSCTAEGAIECNGTCSGSCTKTPPMGDCEGAVEASCEAEADASVMCDGKCDGDFEPPMVMAECDASASCNAQAKAEADINVQCTPPSVVIEYELAADLDAEARAQFEAGIRNLRKRLPALAASFKQSRLVLDAGADLTAAAGDAAQGTIDAFSNGDVNAAAAFKLANCAPDAFEESAMVLGDSTTNLQLAVTDAASLGDVDGLENAF